MRASARRAGRLVQRSATAAGRHDRKAHEVFVRPRKPQVHAGVLADPQQLLTARAAPFPVRGGRGLGFLGAAAAQRAGLAGLDGSRHRGAPLIDGALLLAGRMGDGHPHQERSNGDGICEKRPVSAPWGIQISVVHLGPLVAKQLRQLGEASIVLQD